MQNQFDLRAVAHQIQSAQDEARQIDPLTSQFSGFDPSLAYRMAHLIHLARLDEGAVPIGRKIGFTNPEMWSLYGVREPIWAYNYDTTIVGLSGTRAMCHIGQFVEPKIEPEVVVHFQSAPPAGGDLSQILDCIDWLAHGTEIVQSHFPGWQFQAPDTIAACALHGTHLVGEPQPIERLGADLVRKLEHFSVTLSCNGEVQEVGRGSNVLGSPIAAISHLTGALANQPNATPLGANELVTTGTLTAARSVHSGETWSAELAGVALPGITVQFVT